MGEVGPEGDAGSRDKLGIRRYSAHTLSLSKERREQVMNDIKLAAERTMEKIGDSLSQMDEDLDNKISFYDRMLAGRSDTALQITDIAEKSSYLREEQDALEATLEGVYVWLMNRSMAAKEDETELKVFSRRFLLLFVPMSE